MIKVHLVSFPKSGNTWLRFLLANYFSDTEVNFGNINDITATSKENVKPINGVALIKHHVPSSVVDIGREDFIICIVRNPFSALRSYRNFVSKQNPLLFRTDESFLRGYDRWFGTWGENVDSWVTVPNVLILKYEDLIEDTVGQMSKILHHIGSPVIQERVEASIEASSVDRMSKMSGQAAFMKAINNEVRFVREQSANISEDLLKKHLSGDNSSVDMLRKLYGVELEYKPRDHIEKINIVYSRMAFPIYRLVNYLYKRLC